MRIQHNIMALNVTTILGQRNSSIKKTLEKISSGLRINSAADDASGLAISEEMRSLIFGLEQAERNAQDGVGLLYVGEGSLSTVHDMLNRIKMIAVQASNGTYDDEVSRGQLQSELEEIQYEINRIAQNTNYSGISLFQDKGYDYETSVGRYEGAAKIPDSGTELLAELTAKTKQGDCNIIYTDTTMDFQTAQTGSGTTSSAYDSTGIKNILQKQIVPNVVSDMLSTYTAFSYLMGSSIGIGLDLYSSAGSGVVASVTSSTNAIKGIRTFQLRINMAAVDLSTIDGRSELERTVAHEMMHAFMFEAVSRGMKGSNVGYPLWFIEGMAQTTCGPENWMQFLGIDASSSEAEIQAAIGSSRFNLKSGTDAAATQYGTGYLACMYLGYKASGETVVNAQNIAKGLNKILLRLISGDSLNTAVRYEVGINNASAVSKFQDTFATDPDAAAFIKQLFTATAGGAGGIISGSLTDIDLISDANLAGVNLFQLDTKHQKVENLYPSKVNLDSGSTTGAAGKPPVVDFVTKPDYLEGLFTVNGSKISSVSSAAGYEYDLNSGTLRIKAAGTYRISGGTLVDSLNRTIVGKIVLDDGIAGDVNLIFDGLDIDLSKQAGSEMITNGEAAVNLGSNNSVKLSIGNGSTNFVKSGNHCAGIQMGKLTNIIISDEGAGTGKLEAYGGDYGAGIGSGTGVRSDSLPGGNIVIESGNIKAVSGTANSGAGIGAGLGNSIGNITINGGNIEAIGNRGAGIGSGFAGILGQKGKVGRITINGGAIYAESSASGAGIGSGSGKDNSSGAITITGGDITAKSQSGSGIGSGAAAKSGNITISGGTIKAQGGGSCAGIGSAGISSDTDILISGGTIEAISDTKGAGIGSGNGQWCGNIEITGTAFVKAQGGNGGVGIGTGSEGHCKNIVISGGTVEAIGGAQGAGIGSGVNGYMQDIIISGTAEVKAQGGANGAGIGSGVNGQGGKIEITGGTVTAIGGLTQGGGNIGNYQDRSHNQPSDLIISGAISVKAGVNGEGLYNTSGAVDGQGNSIYSLSLKLDFGNGKTITDISSLSASGKTQSWDPALRHFAPDDQYAYIWMTAEDQKVTVTFDDGTTEELDLEFHTSAGVWRGRGEPDPTPAVKPDNPSDPSAPPDPPDPPDPPSPPNPPNPGEVSRDPGKGIILQIGPDANNIIEIPTFYFSMEALGGDWSVSTQEDAVQTLDGVDNAITRVSSMRGSYGAMQNRLEHSIEGNNTYLENITAAESRIRDADMALEMTELTSDRILLQAGQAMIAQANTLPELILKLLQ